MAKTTCSDGNEKLGILGTMINAVLMNKLLRPLFSSRDVDGHFYAGWEDPTAYGDGNRTGTNIALACAAAAAKGGKVRLTGGTYTIDQSSLDFLGVPLDIGPLCHIIIPSGCVLSNVKIHGEPTHRIFSCAAADFPLLQNSCVLPEWFYDGSGDYTDAIEIANRSISAGILKFSAKTYPVSTVKIRPNHYYKGAGMNSTIFYSISGSNSNVFELDDTMVNRWYFQLRDFQINGNKSNNSSGKGIYIYQDVVDGQSGTQLGTRSIIKNIYIQNCKEHGLHTYGARIVEGYSGFWNVIGLKLDNVRSQSNDGDGVYLQNQTDSHIIELNVSSNLGVGIRTRYCANNRFLSCKTFYNGNGSIELGTGYHSYGCYGDRYVGCEAQEEYGNGWYVYAMRYGSFNGCMGDSSGRVGNEKTGFVFDNCNGINFDGVACNMHSINDNESWQGVGISITDCYRSHFKLAAMFNAFKDYELSGNYKDCSLHINGKKVINHDSHELIGSLPELITKENLETIPKVKVAHDSGSSVSLYDFDFENTSGYDGVRARFFANTEAEGWVNVAWHKGKSGQNATAVNLWRLSEDINEFGRTGSGYSVFQHELRTEQKYTQNYLKSIALVVNTPHWIEFIYTHTQFQAAALESYISIGSLDGVLIHAVRIKHSTAFAGTEIATYKVSCGVSTSKEKFAEKFDVFSATGVTNYLMNSMLYREVNSLRVYAYSTGANLDQSTAGQVSVAILLSKSIGY
jgi:hypothetical protein